MTELPYVLVSCAISLDGYLDDASPNRLMLSGTVDLAQVDAIRAAHDAIMVGAATIRRDNPRLLVRDPRLQAERKALGRPPSPTRVTLTDSGDLDPTAHFFSVGSAPQLVYCGSEVTLRDLGPLAEVVNLGYPLSLPQVLSDLRQRGIARLMVEGGGRLLTQLFAADLVDELRLSVAPLFVGEVTAPRFVCTALPVWTAARRARLVSVDQVGENAVLRYVR